MIKAKLEKLRTLNATPAMIKAISQPGRKKDYWDNKVHKYRYCLVARCQHLDGILKISMCTRKDLQNGISTPKWDIYINYDGDEYITRERQQDGTYKWRTAYIMNLESGYYWHPNYDQHIYMNPEGKRSIRQLLESKEEDVYKCIQRWQEGCKKRVEDKKIKKMTDQWDQDMIPIKEPPKGFEKWYKTVGFNGSHEVYYSGVGAEEGYCTNCMRMISLQSMKKITHNMDGRCPECRKKVTFISRKVKKSPVWTTWRSVACAQRYKSGLVVRTFCIRREDERKRTGIDQSSYIVEEYRREILLDGVYRMYEYTDYRRRGYRWSQKNGEFYRYTDNIYPNNINSLLKNMHTSFLIAVKNGVSKSEILYFMYIEKKYPLIEMLFKAGMYELGKDVKEEEYRFSDLKIDMTQHELAKILLIDKSRLQRLRNMNGNICMLSILQEEKKRNTIYREEDIQIMTSIEQDDILQEEIFHHLSVEKVCNYIRKQQGIRQRSERNIWHDWMDYIGMMKKMKMDYTNEQLLKPSDLQIAHNELVAKISFLDKKSEIKKKEKMFKAAEKLMRSGELKKYEYSNDKYCIMAPAGIADIYAEGIALKHCIHTCDIYFQRIDIRESYLLFLRQTKDPERPWYTIEVEPGGNIRQKKSVLNETYKDLEDAIPFLTAWQQWVKKNLSAEDKKLAAASDQARKDGYKKLRQEKKLIWHGRLQGTLLADALESDFMEAL